ncbi:hypothetical protein [Marinobacter salexigens]|nr:hypothetical protein [Marinobacter salexigens]
MKHRNVRLTDEALADIDSATAFYEKLVAGDTRANPRNAEKRLGS